MGSRGGSGAAAALEKSSRSNDRHLSLSNAYNDLFHMTLLSYILPDRRQSHMFRPAPPRRISWAATSSTSHARHRQPRAPSKSLRGGSFTSLPLDILRFHMSDTYSLGV